MKFTTRVLYVESFPKEHTHYMFSHAEKTKPAWPGAAPGPAAAAGSGRPTTQPGPSAFFGPSLLGLPSLMEDAYGKRNLFEPSPGVLSGFSIIEPWTSSNCPNLYRLASFFEQGQKLVPPPAKSPCNFHQVSLSSVCYTWNILLSLELSSNSVL